MTTWQENRPIYAIAQEIVKDWKTLRTAGYAALPYVEAMLTIDQLEDGYIFPGRSAGVSIVAGFLANARMWRGETARRIKKELNGMIGA